MEFSVPGGLSSLVCCCGFVRPFLGDYYGWVQYGMYGWCVYVLFGRGNRDQDRQVEVERNDTSGAPQFRDSVEPSRSMEIGRLLDIGEGRQTYGSLQRCSGREERNDVGCRIVVVVCMSMVWEGFGGGCLFSCV